MRSAAALVLSTIALAQPETREFKVLVAPSESVDASSWKTNDIAAHIGKSEYKVQRVQPLGSAGKTVIVLDFGSTSPTLHACLLAETLSALAHLKQFPTPMLVAAEYAPGLTSIVRFGPKEYVVYGGGDLKEVTRACETGTPRRGRYPGSGAGAFGSIRIFDILSNVFGQNDGPVRVFWLSQYFDWFDLRAAPGCSLIAPAGDACHQPAPNVAFRDMKSISDVDLTVFPIVFGDHRHGHLVRLGREQIKGANYMAQYLGGFATPVSGAIGETLSRVLEETQRSALVSLAGPATDAKQPATLVLRAASPNTAAIWQRPFIVNDGHGDVHLPGWAQVPPWQLTPFVLTSSDLRIDFGCRVPDSEPQPSLRILLPAEVISASPGNVEIELHYQNEKGLSIQRYDVDRSADPSELICIPLIHARDGTRFSVVVRDQSTGWIGGTDGTLVKNAGQSPR